MSIAMHDNHVAGESNPALLRPGTLIYLWQPGEERGVDRTLARVERATVDNILAVDLSDGSRGKYEVGNDPGNRTALRWTWEVAAPARRSSIGCDGIERVEGSSMTLEERIAAVCGAPGAKITVRLKSGEAFPGVTLSKLIMGRDDDWEAEWCVFSAEPDCRGELAHVFRTDEIAGFSRDVHG